MGIIGDAFKKLFDALWMVIAWIGQQISNFFQTLIDLLVKFFEILFDLIQGVLYLLFKIGQVAAELFILLFTAATYLWSLAKGLFKTMGQLVFNPIGQSPNNAYGATIGNVMTQANSALQLSSIAYILLFLIWLTAAIAAIKIVASIRVGGS